MKAGKFEGSGTCIDEDVGKFFSVVRFAGDRLLVVEANLIREMGR